MAWATIEQVAGQTGVEVTAETLALASAIIDTFTGADEEMPEDAITAQDRRYLRRATAWQAVWTAPKAGLITERENASTLTSDGQTVAREDRADALLAPLARRELMNLSWIGTRTVRVPRSPSADRRNFLNEASDAYGEWSPL